MNSFGQKLKSLRKNKEKTQEEVANDLGMQRITYAQYEIDRREADYDTIKKIANYYGVTTDWLLGRSDSPVEYTVEEKQFLVDLSLSDEELFKKYRFAFGDKEYTEDETKALLNILRSVQVLSKKDDK